LGGREGNEEYEREYEGRNNRMRLVNRVVPGAFLIAAVGELRAWRLSRLKLTGLQASSAFAAVRQALSKEGCGEKCR